MKKIILLLLTITVALFGVTKGQSTESPQLSEKGIGAIQIGIPLAEALKAAAGFGEVKKTEKMEEGDLYTIYEVVKNKEVLFLIDPMDEKISRLRILSPQFKTDKNIGIGSTLAELLKAYPLLKIGPSEYSGMGACALSEKLGFSFFFKSEKPKPSDPVTLILVFGR